MTDSSGDVDPFEALLAELKPEVIAPKVIEPTADVAVLDPEETSTILRLSIRESLFRVTGGATVELGDDPLKIVILKAAPLSRMYYSEAYTDGQSKAPTCWSTDAGGGLPAIQVPIDNRQAAACLNCPQDIRGSGNGSSKACRYQQRLAVMLADKDGVLQLNQVCQLSLPATSVFAKDKKKKGLQTYAKLIQDQGALLSMILTELSFDKDSSTPKLCFRPSRVLTDAETEVVKDVQKDPKTKRLITFNPKPYVDDGPSMDNVFSTVKGDGVYVRSL